MENTNEKQPFNRTKLFYLVITLLFAILCYNIFGQNTSYPFSVKVSGKGERHVLLIPGFACAGEVWDATRTQLEKDYTCHTLTMAGFAGIAPQANASFKNWEKGIAAYIKEQHLGKTLLIGHSMGGGLAMAVAASHPDLVSKILVVDAVPCLAALSDPKFASNAANDCGPMVKRFTAMNDQQFYQMQKASMPQLLADTSKLETVVSWSLRSDRATCAEMFCDFSNTDLRETIAAVKCPAVILLESYFVNFKPAIEGQYKKLKSANLQFANKGLHFIMYDDKEWFDQQVLAFTRL